MITSRSTTRRTAASCAVVALVSSLVACTSSSDGPDRSSAPPATKASTAAAVTPTFTVPTDPKSADRPRVARYEDTTVVLQTGTVRGVAASGAVRWTFAVPQPYSNPVTLDAVVDGAVTVLSRDVGGATVVRVVNTATGRLRWQVRAKAVETVAGTVFVTNCAGDTTCSLSAREPDTGQVRWKRDAAGTPYGRTGALGRVVPLDAPAVGGAALFEVDPGPVLPGRSHLAAYDVATGRSRDVDAPVGVPVGDGNIVASLLSDTTARDGCIGRIVAADVTTGKRVWARSWPVPANGNDKDQPCHDLDPVSTGGGLGVTPADGHPVVIDLRNGRDVVRLAGVTGSVVSRIGTTTIVRRPDPGGLVAVDARGTVRWTRPDFGFFDTVAVVHGRLVIGTADCINACVVVRPVTGAVVGRVAGRVAGSGDDWIATWDRPRTIVRVYAVR